jgi:hypothetical protein
MPPSNVTVIWEQAWTPFNNISTPVQIVATSNNVIPEGAVLLNNSMPGQLVLNYTVPTGKVPPSAKISSSTNFFKSTTSYKPGKLFAVTDYGANTSSLDNLAAIQAAIDAVRCAFSHRSLHSRMPLVPTPARLQQACVCPMTFLSGVHSSYRFAR